MIFIKIGLTLCAAMVGINADVSPGQNAYLPPDKGYNYPKPPKPFPTPTRPPVTRPPVTPPTFTPTRPSFTPTKPTYGPPTFTPTRPTYGPPTFTPTRPTGVTPTRPPYRPPPTHRPPIDGSGSDNHDHHDHHDHHHHHEPGMPFDFAYAVNDVEHGNDYSHNAVSDGDITRGEYRIQLPDGRLQVVKYTADWKNGFNAQVSYEGQINYPQPGGGGYKY